MLQFFYISLPPVSNNFLQFSCLEFPPNIVRTEEFWMRKHDDDCCWGLWGATRKCQEMNRGVSHGESDAEAEEKTEEVERMYEVWGTHLSHDSHHNQQWIVDIGSLILPLLNQNILKQMSQSIVSAAFTKLQMSYCVWAEWQFLPPAISQWALLVL